MGTVKQNVLAAFRRLFRPIARILLRAGVNWKELAEVAKASYVEVATADFGVRGRPTNVSKVALLTGFTRREVRRLRSLLAEDDTLVFDRMNRATRVLSAWHTDPDFIDGDGNPKTLAVSGETDSFEALCKRYAGDVPSTTMQKALLNVGAIHGDNGQLSALSRYYMPATMDAEQVLRSGSVVEDLANTVAHNLNRKHDEPSRFEGRATATRIPKHVIPEFRAFLEDEGQAFLERVDEWLAEYELKDDSTDDGVRLGLGAYWIEH